MARNDPVSGTAISVRLPKEVAAEIALIARIEGVSVSEVIRAGIYRHLSLLHDDPAFQDRLRKRLEEDREILERYSPGEG
ncbi:MAG TPA: ribbon-helix-helix protein, CopG family [Solirubrobacterales bacterium]|nr:ribbon-helix-helix protein, CopG family [Solirubrobacterales bacterium]